VLSSLGGSRSDSMDLSLYRIPAIRPRAERDQRLPGRQFGLFIDISERDRGSRQHAE
jgi:hypothetical protein